MTANPPVARPGGGLTGMMCGLSTGLFFAVVSKFLAARSASEQD